MTTQPSSDPVGSHRSAVGLEICRGRSEHSFRPISGNRFVIGSAPECDLRLGGDTVPAVHSQLHIDGGKAWVEAVAADPPLLINGEDCETARLADGDTIGIGGFVFTWKAPCSMESDLVEATSLTAAELIDRLEADLELVSRHVTAARRGATTLLEASLGRIYGDSVVAEQATVVPGDDQALAARLEELVRRMDARELEYSEVIASLLEGQDRLSAQLELLVNRLAGQQLDGESLRASA
jgi:predicted component of type VI protein secretion system